MNQYLHGYIARSKFHHGMGLLVLIIFGLGIWGWFSTIKLERIRVTGTESVTPADVRDLAAMEPGEILYDIDKRSLVARVEAHPWVLEADISRFPNGTLRISVTERVPVVLVLNASGRSVFYLDRDGVRLPDQAANPYDVPIFRGYSDGFELTGITKNSTVIEFLNAVADNGSDTSGLISEVSLTTGQIGLRLEPVANQQAVPVKLGSSAFEEKLGRLHAFWKQAMLPRQDKKYEWIDLRYDSQIVTRETHP